MNILNQSLQEVKQKNRKKQDNDRNTCQPLQQNMGQNMSRTIKEIASHTIDLIYPPACPICGRPAPFEEGIRLPVCPECEKDLSKTGSNCCMKCGKPLQDETAEYCYDCSKTHHLYTQGAAAFAYTDGIKQSIYRYKYKNRREYAAYYAKQIYENCGGRMSTWKADVLIPVPLHSSKLWKRGFNQAELIAEHLSKLTGIPVDGEVLVRSRKTIPMKNLDDQERIENLKNAFHIKDNVVEYNKVILVDDIYTTGTTIDECTKVLMDRGASNVYFVCLCIGRGF